MQTSHSMSVSDSTRTGSIVFGGGFSAGPIGPG